MASATRVVLFTDIVASTELLRRLGTDRNEEVRRAHFSALRGAVAAHEGEEVKSTGDGLMVVFDGATGALACAVAMQQSVDRLNRREGSLGLAMRIGLAVGELTAEGDDWYGAAVVEAARLCDSASGEQILLSDLVAAVAGGGEGEAAGGGRFISHGARPLKGLADPLEVYEVEWERAAAAVPLPAAVTTAGTTVLVGRGDELARLHDEWQEVTSGARRTVFVAGEPGIGKTALVAALARDVHRAGCTVLFGHCDEAVADPYQPFVEALRHLLATTAVDGMVTQTVPAELRRLLPELADRAGHGDTAGGGPVSPEPEPEPGPDPEPTDPDSERFLLFSAVESLLAAVAQEGALLLILEDVHWAARPTLLLLRHLLQSPLSMRILTVVTYRDTETTDVMVTQGLAELRRLAGVSRLELGGLSEHDVHEWVGASIGEPAAPEARRLVTAIHHETDGNPFFVDQVLRHLVESGRLRTNGAGELEVAGALEGVGIPDGVREAIDRRLQRLAPVTRQVLVAAAVAGRRFELSLLERLAGLDVDGDDVLDALDEAAAAHVVVETPGRPGLYSFEHALLHQALSESIESIDRARLHLDVAMALEEREATADNVAAMVRHYAAAAPVGGAARAARHALAGAETACARAAFEEAVALLEEALAALDANSAEQRELRYDLLIGLSHARRMGLEYNLADDASRAAAELARRLGSAHRLAEAAIALAAGNPPLGTVNDEVVSLCEEASAWLGADHPGLRAQLLAALAAHRSMGGESAGVDELSATAVAMARAAGDTDALWAALLGRYTALTGSPHARELLAVGEELMTMPVPPAGHRPNWLTVEVGPSPRALPRLMLGDRAGFDADVAEVERLSASYPRRATLAMLAQWRALQAFLRGDLAAAEESANLLMAVSGGGGNFGQAHAALLFWLAFERGRLDELLPALEATVAAEPSMAAFRSSLAVFLAHLGRQREAAAQLDVLATDDFSGITPDFTFAASLFCLGEVCALLDDRPGAQLLLERFTPYAGLLNVLGPGTVCMGAVDRTLGILHAVGEESDDPEGALERALALETAVDAPPLMARTRFWWAWMLLRRDGRTSRALDLLHQVTTASDRLGMAGLNQQARRLAAGTGAG